MIATSYRVVDLVVSQFKTARKSTALTLNIKMDSNDGPQTKATYDGKILLDW
jgi:hypothetical protein